MSRKTLSLVHRVREPSVAPAQSERAPLLILFHGVGSNELAMVALAERFDARFVVISARSPIELAPYAFGWFRVTFTIGEPVIDGDELQAALTSATSFIDEAVAAYDADPTRVFVAGFSQGGIVAVATLLTAPEKIAGAVCMSGRLPPEVLPHVVSLDRLRDKPVLIVHGTHDETLGVTYGRSAREMLRRFPLRLEYREFEMGHTTSDESMATVAAWLTARLSP